MVATVLKVRSFNPIWLNDDLSGNLFDDTFYLFVLENTLPYVPATVWEDPSGSTPHTNPIRYLANGTLPVNIYWDPDTVYRLEFRQGPTQSSPLIYLVENYIPNGGNNVPPFDIIGINTDNQITNAQFADIHFSSPLVLTNVTDMTVDVGAGWELVLSGTGSLTLTRVPLNSTLPTPTNAPYALRVQATGGSFTDVVLQQRFQQNGNLWAGKFIASSITARSQVVNEVISAVLTDSLGTDIGVVLPSTPLSSSFEEYTGTSGQLPASTDTQFPPDASITYRLIFPVPTFDIYVTSFQLIATDVDAEFDYIQDTVDRQIDHTFHVYRDSILMQPKDSILTGWDFGLNPWQFRTTASTNVANNTYTADQTIVIQQAYVASATANNVAVAQASAANNRAFSVTAVTANNRFGLLQYIDAATMGPYWLSKVSSLVKARLITTHGTSVRFKMRLISSSSIPSATSQTYPVATFPDPWNASSEPTFNGAFTVLMPVNDPIYTLSNTSQYFSFDGFDLSQITVGGGNQTLGIFIYTLDNANQAATADQILFESISLVPNDFAIASNPKTFDETLRDCEYYYEKTYDQGILPGSVTSIGPNSLPIVAQTVWDGSLNQVTIFAGMISWQYRTVKRAAPTIAPYSALNANVADAFDAFRYINGGSVNTGVSPKSFSGFFTLSSISTKHAQYDSSVTTPIFTTTPLTAVAYAYALFHATMDSRIG